MARAVYTSVCHGGQNNRIGDCRLSARDPRTGHTRWTIPTYASVQVADVDPPGRLAPPMVPPYLVVYSFPTGFDSRTLTTVDPKSGHRLGTSVRAQGSIQTEGALIGIDEEQNEKAKGCKTALTAWDPEGAGAIWRRTVAGLPDSHGHCSHVDGDIIGDGQLAVVDSSGKTTLLSLANGKTTWTASEPGEPVLVGQGFVLTTTASGGLAYHDRASNKVRWRTPTVKGGNAHAHEWGAVVLGNWLAVYDRDASPYCPRQCPTVDILDPASGSLYRAPPGRFVGAGNGVVITETQQTGSQTSEYHAFSTA